MLYVSCTALFVLIDLVFSDASIVVNYEQLLGRKRKQIFWKIREKHIRQTVDHSVWLEAYNDRTFYELFRMQRTTFRKFVDVLIAQDTNNLIRKKYRGGNYLVAPEKSVLVFLWFLSRQDTLLSIADHFDLVPSTVMNIVNSLLYLIVMQVIVTFRYL